MRTAILHINGLGDQLIAWPTLRALRRVLPGHFELWTGRGMVRSIYRDVEMERFGIAAVGPELRELDVAGVPADRPRIDLFVSLSTWCNDSVLALAHRLRAGHTVGLDGDLDVVLKDGRDQNMFDQLFALAKHFDPRLVLEDFAAPPTFSDAAEDAARARVAQHLAPGQRMLFVHPETRPRKMWTPEAWSAVVRAMLEAQPELVAFVSSRRPYPLDVGPHQARVVELLDTPFEMTLAVLRAASLFVGVDSCFLHGADLLRVPAVGLFGPTHPATWGFRLERRSRAIHTGGAPLDALSPHAVVDALLSLVRR